MNCRPNPHIQVIVHFRFVISLATVLMDSPRLELNQYSVVSVLDSPVSSGV
jgi:hypothetical protein